MNVSDYLHRVGRVGRVTSPANCKATHLVQGGLQVRSWLPDGYSQIFRSYVLGPSGFWTTMAPLC